MRAREFAPVERLDTAPDADEASPQERHEAVEDALREVELGAFDRAAMDSLVWRLDLPTLRAVVSLFERIRRAGRVEMLNVEAVLHEEHRAYPRGHDPRF